MVGLYFVLALVTSSVWAQEDYREANAEERVVLLPKSEEEKLKDLGKEMARDHEVTLMEQVLIKQSIEKGHLNLNSAKDYIQKLTDLGFSKEEIKSRTDQISKEYFAQLQLKNSEQILSKEKKDNFEKKINQLGEDFEDGKSDQGSLDKEISNLQNEIDSSPITKENEEKYLKFKQEFQSSLQDNTYVAKPIIHDPKLDDSIKIMVPKDFSFSKNNSKQDMCFTCLKSDTPDPLGSEAKQLNLQIEDITKTKKPLIHKVYFSWGYNRNYHSKTDVKFKTTDGTFTVHKAVGEDRPSPFDPKIYFNPSKFSIPQYNVELGVMFNSKWGTEVKMDHMKYIFDNQRPYEISGEFNRKVVIKNENPTSDWDTVIPVSFSEAVAKKDATWLGFEHSDGYNYISVGAVYNQNLYQTKNKKFQVDARFGTGAGLMVPKTKVMFHIDERWQWKGLDNKFHIAGGGVHGETKLRFTFWDAVYFQAATRGTYIKVKDALVNDEGARMEHIQPIASVQFMGQIGYSHTIGKKKDMKKKKK